MSPSREDALDRRAGEPEPVADSHPEPSASGPPVGRFLAVVGTWLTAWWVVLGLLFAPVLPGGWPTILGCALLSAAPLAVLVRGFSRSVYPTAAVRLWVLRPFWYVQLALPLLAAAGVVGGLAGLLVVGPGRLGRAAVGVAGVALAIFAVVGYVGSRRLRTAHLELAFPALPPAFDGLRVVQLSDLHVGPHTSRAYLVRVARAVAAARPDLIAVTGDQVDDFARDVVHFDAAFRGLAAPLGVFAVAGNHDVYAGWGEVRAGLEAMGLRVLVNDAVPLRRGDDVIWIAGTGDPAGRGWSRGGGDDAAPDLDRTVAPIPDGAFTLALAHNPVLWPPLVRRGVQLTLSGHTHHGQLSIPRLRWSLASPFLDLDMGTHRDGAAILYISPGTNYWGLPFRIGALPEVSVITLRRGAMPPGDEGVTPASPADG